MDDATAPAPSGDDWETHWDEFSDTAEDNPAQAYRRTLVLRHLGAGSVAPRRVLDIGSGQGDLLATVRERWPDAELRGYELSASGIREAAAKVPGAAFEQIDLEHDEPPAPQVGWADVAVCSEVLEHVDDPARLLRNGARSVAPGGRIVITVPGGPRTAFDRHIGHRRHFDRRSLTDVITGAGLEPEMVRGHGFPFFNVYKLAVLARGDRVIADVAASTEPSRVAELVMRAFGYVLRPGFCSSRAGWQLVAVARCPSATGRSGPGVTAS